MIHAQREPYWLRNLLHRRYVDSAYGSGYDEDREHELPRPLGCSRIPWPHDLYVNRAFAQAGVAGRQGRSSIVRWPGEPTRKPYRIEKHVRPPRSRGANDR